MGSPVEDSEVRQRSSGFKRFLALLLSFALGIVAGVAIVFLFNRWTADFSKYTGEGIPRETLTPLERIRWLPFTLLPRYELELTAFDMREPFVKEFRFSGLPKNVRGDAMVIFKVVSLTWYNDFFRIEPQINPTGTLRYRLQKNSEEIFDVSGDVEFFRIDSATPTSRGPLYEHRIYFYEESEDPATLFNPHAFKPDDVLTLLIEYEPGTDPVQGFCVPMVRAGGSF